MIKKYNENWGSLNDKYGDYDLRPLGGESWQDVYKRAKNLAISKNKEVKYLFNSVEHTVRPNTDKNSLYNEYVKKSSSNNGSKGKDEESKEYWRDYWNKISRDVNSEMDTIAEFAKKNSISYEEAKDYFTSSKENETPKKVEFGKGFEIIGLPSGQVIYMNNAQLQYFKARELVYWMKTWKKPLTGGFVPIRMNAFCFEDRRYEHILELINMIVW